MNRKDQVWKFATAFVVILILFNPEMLELALFIDAVGLEMFLMLIEIQVVVLFGAFYNSKIKPVYNYMKLILLKGWSFLKQESIISPVLAAQGSAIVMNVMVISTAILSLGHL